MRSSQSDRRPPIRVAVVGQHGLIVETFTVALEKVCRPCPVYVPAGAARDAMASSILAVRPRVAVLRLDGLCQDPDLPLEQLASAGVVTTVLTEHHDDARFGQFVRRGAEAALSTAIGLSRLVNVIDRVSARKPAMDPLELDRLRQAARVPERREGLPTGPARAGVDRLSARERQVLRALMAGLAPAAIARRSYVSEATVRTQVRSILAKLGVSSQLAAVAVGYQAGWEPDVGEDRAGSERAS